MAPAPRPFPTAEQRARFVDWWVLESGLGFDELRELAEDIWPELAGTRSALRLIENAPQSAGVVVPAGSKR
jgi:hypothetical protein